MYPRQARLLKTGNTETGEHKGVFSNVKSVYLIIGGSLYRAIGRRIPALPCLNRSP